MGVLVPKPPRVSRTSDNPCRDSPRVQPLARTTHRRKPPRPCSTHPRETMRVETRPEMPSVVQGPSPRSTLSNARLRTSTGSRLCHRDPDSHRLFSRTLALASPRTLGPRPRVPLPWEARFSEPEVTLVDFCNLVTTHEHTLRAPQSSHASGALAPLHASVETDAGCVGPSDALPHRRPVSRALLTTACAHRDPLAWTGQECESGPLEEGKPRALWTISRVPFSWRPGHPGHRFDAQRSLEDLATFRLGQDSPRMPPREGWRRRTSQGAFYRKRTLTRAEDGSPVRAWIEAPSRRLFAEALLESYRASFSHPASAFFWRWKHSGGVGQSKQRRR